MESGFWPPGPKILYEFVKDDGDRTGVENMAFTTIVVCPIGVVVKHGRDGLSGPVGRTLAHKGSKALNVSRA